MGVGKATAMKLAALGVTTAAGLRDMPMKQTQCVGTVVLERLVASPLTLLRRSSRNARAWLSRGPSGRP